MPDNLLKLNLGCGGDIREGYVNIDKYDFRQPEVVVRADIFTINYPDNSIDEILLSHVIEHLTIWKVPSLFSNCYRMLKQGCKLIITVPDIDKLCRAWVDATDRQERYIVLNAIFSPHQSDLITGDTISPHIWGWCHEHLNEHLSQAGFSNVIYSDGESKTPGRNWCIKAEAVK